MLEVKKEFTLNKGVNNQEIIKNMQAKWGEQNNGILRFQEIALWELLKVYPENKDYDQVLTKCAFINSMFSTHMYNKELQQVAAKISSYAEFDGKLSGDNQNELIDFITASTNRRIFSFATKYCAAHREEKFPIYDQLVVDALGYYQNKDKFYENGFTKKRLKDYKEYIEVYSSFITYYGLTSCTYREVDKYLWTIIKLSSNK